MWVQIFGHSSVQPSSTFGSRKARKPIYILRFKKIEQGQLLYPKIFPPIFQDFLVNILFWSHNHNFINSWSWLHKLGSKIIKVSKVSILDSWKVNCKLTKAQLFHGSSEKSHPMLILKGMTFPTTHLHIPSPRNALTKSYQFQHYRSFSKVNKKAL